MSKNLSNNKHKKELSAAERTIWLEKARTLSEALPYMRFYTGKTFVVKFGGHAMGDASLTELFARDIVLFKQVGINPIVVHGGGPQIGEMLERLKIKSSFVDGLRVTDKETVKVVEMVLSGSINKQIVTAISEAGGRAIGISGKDNNLIQAKKLRRKFPGSVSSVEKIVDLGFVGEPTKINAEILAELSQSDVIPVIAPLGAGPRDTTLNINADTAAGAVAGAVNAARLLMLTDVPGVLDKKGKLIPEMTAAQARARKRDKTIYGGMIPKVETCLDAVGKGVDAAVILDGRVPHALLLEIFTEHGVGTLIRDQLSRRKRK